MRTIENNEYQYEDYREYITNIYMKTIKNKEYQYEDY